MDEELEKLTGLVNGHQNVEQKKQMLSLLQELVKLKKLIDEVEAEGEQQEQSCCDENQEMETGALLDQINDKAEEFRDFLFKDVYYDLKTIYGEDLAKCLMNDYIDLDEIEG